jgi:SAM-dependent methyltransferase
MFQKSVTVDDPMAIGVSEPGSFRDREGHIFYWSGNVYRTLSNKALTDWKQLAATRFFSEATSQGHLVQTDFMSEMAVPKAVENAHIAGILKHQTVPFISYPYEWCFGMLKDAALLHLSLLLSALEEGMVLKDASAFNMQWIGEKPLFIDISSFEAYQPGAPWVGYNQFCQMFLNPLLLQAYKDVPFHPWLRGCINGIEPAHMANLMGIKDLCLPGVFKHVYLHSKLQENMNRNTQKSNLKGTLSQAGFHLELIRNNIKNLQHVIANLSWKKAHSVWSDYADNTSYKKNEEEQKVNFVRKVVMEKQARWEQVWDLGCNTGNFSRIAAENANYVIALDADHLAIERLYQNLKKEKSGSILPLYANLADPSTGLGWQGTERKPLWERGKPELIMALALIHHVVISANVPMRAFISWLAQLTPNLIIEFITKEDPMVQLLLQNKTDNYTDYDQNYFEQCLLEHFTIELSQDLINGCRTIYYCRAKG